MNSKDSILELARATYLEALSAAMFAGRLARGGGAVEISEAALAGPPPASGAASVRSPASQGWRFSSPPATRPERRCLRGTPRVPAGDSPTDPKRPGGLWFAGGLGGVASLGRRGLDGAFDAAS